MVNQKGLSTRAFILRELRRNEGAPVSGEALAHGAGISRVAVWKGVRSLVAAGYSIVSEEAGYRLAAAAEDFLYPWEFGEKERLFQHFVSTDSTMDRSREAAEQGLGSGTVITAETQTAGRGRSGRAWASKPGGLFFTILERPDMAVADYAQASMEAQIAAARTVERLCGKRAALRWPNDVYIKGKKIAGILTELSGEGDRIRWISCGVGLNINNRTAADATSCAKIAGHDLSRREGLTVFLNEAEKLRSSLAASDAGRQELAALWNSLAEGIGAEVLIIPAEHGNSKTVGENRILGKGIFSGLDPSGRCIIKTKAGKERAAAPLMYSPGSVSLIFKGL
ncbi:bifunctional biotin--[acetyl-CoA-carboxylase] synthetase/biotin operon repressor [Spirochaetia bacterium]|nr:bifunctional biotin--[acetyl-CoA-carboxylase] synthetase/biotin operon repressor [Spirochaetia bacterium]